MKSYIENALLSLNNFLERSPSTLYSLYFSVPTDREHFYLNFISQKFFIFPGIVLYISQY